MPADTALFALISSWGNKEARNTTGAGGRQNIYNGGTLEGCVSMQGARWRDACCKTGPRGCRRRPRIAMLAGPAGRREARQGKDWQSFVEWSEECVEGRDGGEKGLGRVRGSTRAQRRPAPGRGGCSCLSCCWFLGSRSAGARRAGAGGPQRRRRLACCGGSDAAGQRLTRRRCMRAAARHSRVDGASGGPWRTLTRHCRGAAQALAIGEVADFSRSGTSSCSSWADAEPAGAAAAGWRRGGQGGRCTVGPRARRLLRQGQRARVRRGCPPTAAASPPSRL